MRYIKILINISLWHLKPYHLKGNIDSSLITEFGWLCFKLIITWN